MASSFRGTVLAAACMLALAACGGENAAPAAASAIPVTSTVVQPLAWADTVQALGTAQARESVTLTAKVSEIVERVHFDSGDRVAAGAPLVTLRGDAQQAALGEARATLAEAEQQYRRLQGLAGQQLVARSSLDAQRAQRDVAAARVRQMESDIRDRHVRAPFAGVLGIRQVSPGALLTPSSVIATLDDIDRMYVDFQVPEAALSTLAPGASVIATGAAWPGREFQGQVQTIDSRIDPQTRALTVRAAFDNPQALLRPGMLLQVELLRPQRQALVVPEIAVVQVGQESFVYRVGQGNVVERVPVRTGTRRDGQVELVDGLAAGQRIVVDGTGKLRPGAVVAEAAPAKAAVQASGAPPAKADAQGTAPRPE